MKEERIIAEERWPCCAQRIFMNELEEVIEQKITHGCH